MASLPKMRSKPTYPFPLWGESQQVPLPFEERLGEGQHPQQVYPPLISP